jgi:hypothetical protein
MATDTTLVSRSRTSITAIAAGALSAASLLGSQVVAHAATPAAGFAQPYAGTPKYQQYAPTEGTGARQINRPLGSKAACRSSKDSPCRSQVTTTTTAKDGANKASFAVMAATQGKKNLDVHVTQAFHLHEHVRQAPLRQRQRQGDAHGAEQLRAVRQPCRDAMSLANTSAPTRKVNVVLAPGGYLREWCRKNGAQDALRMLYQSAYT